MDFIKKILYSSVAQSVGSTTVIIGFFRIAAMVANVLQARQLSEADFGEFVLVRTLILVIPPIAIWGQNVAAARFFSKNDIRQYDWHRSFIRAMLVCFVLSFVSVAIGVYYYGRVNITFFALIFLPTFAYSVNLYLSNIVRSQKKYFLSLVINEGFRVIFLIVIMVCYYLIGLNLFISNWSFSGSIVLITAFAIWYSFRQLPCGSKPVPKELGQDAFILMIIAASVDIFGNLDRLVIGGKLSMEDLALYAAVFTPLQIYMIFNRATHWVLVPVFGKQKQVGLWKYTIVTLLIAIVITLPFIFFGKPILHLLYDGKFDRGGALLGLLAISQAERMLYTMASSLIIGRLKQVALRLHMWFTVISVLFYIVSTYFGVIYYGIWGAAYSVLLTHFIRMASAYVIAWIYRDEWLKARPEQVEEINGEFA